MHFKNSTRLDFRWLAKSIETNKLSDRSCCRCYFLCFYISMLNLKYFLNNNLILFLEKNYKEQAQMFYQNHSLSLHWVEIFGIQFSKIAECGLGKSRTALLSSYQLYDILDLDAKNNWTALLGSDWFYDILELDLKVTGFGLILWFIGLGLEKYLD